MNPDNVLIMSFDPRLHSYTPERTGRFLGDLRRRAEKLPGVRSVSFVDIVPLSIGVTEDAKAKTLGEDVRRPARTRAAG